jgi:hypothetical protein
MARLRAEVMEKVHPCSECAGHGGRYLTIQFPGGKRRSDWIRCECCHGSRIAPKPIVVTAK